MLEICINPIFWWSVKKGQLLSQTTFITMNSQPKSGTSNYPVVSLEKSKSGSSTKLIISIHIAGPPLSQLPAITNSPGTVL